MVVRVVSLLMFALAALCAREALMLADGKLHVHVLDVGQGDAIFIVTPSGKQILVDGGPDLSVLSHLSTLMPFFDRSIDLVVLTHTDSDHITSLPQVCKRYSVGAALLSGDLGNSGKVDALVDVLQHSNTDVLLADPAIDISFTDGVTLDTVWPTPDAGKRDALSRNNLSVVFRILYKDQKILLTGDIEEQAESQLLATGADIDTDVLKVAHHGSKTSTSTGFLLAATPDTAVISVGKSNRYGHPHAQVVDRLHHFGIPTKTTAERGVVSMEFE